MAGFRQNVFRGIRPRVSKRKLAPGEAQIAQNTKLGSADLEPWDENRVLGNTFDPYNTRTIFLYDNANQDVWFEFSDFVDVARGPIRGDTLDRVYFTGDGVPKITYNTLQGSPPYPTVAYDLGVPKPQTPLRAAGQTLPEDQNPDARRTSTAAGERPQTSSFEIVNAEFTTYPGTGTPNDTWRFSAEAAGDIVFDLNVGDTLRVLSVIDEDNFTVGSATGAGAVAATRRNDKTSVNFWQPMDEQGSTQEADFIGWRVPDGLQVTVAGHRLRVGDIIRVTRLDNSQGFTWSWNLTSDLFELGADGQAGDWGVPSQDPDTLVYSHENVLLGRDANAATTFELNGGFYYDVDRTASDSDSLEDRTYVYTFVSSIGEEGPPSDPSTLVSALDGDTIVLTGFDLAPQGFRDIDRIRIYRTNSTAIGTEYQFVREVALSQVRTDGEAIDAVPAAALGEIIPSTTWFIPPADMQGIVSMPNGMMVGFAGKNIYFCEPYQPHAYPPEYDQAVDFEIVALAPFGNSVAVLTKGNPYVITGSHPRNVNIRPYKINQACLYKESVALAKDKVFYASPDGLVEIGVNGARVATLPYAKKDEWQQFQPDSMVGEFYDGKYFGFFGADNTVTPQPPASVAATGTLLTDLETFEREIVAGGKTIILTLTDDTWQPAGNAFDAIRTDIIFSITGSGSEPGGWNAVRSQIAVGSVVRTSDTVVTITLPAINYSITETETLAFRAPALALAGGTRLVAPETATVFNDSIYSSQIVVVTGPATGADLPEILASDENIENWVRIQEPDGILAARATRLTDGAYHKTLNRWAVVGYDTLNNDASRILTSDNVNIQSEWANRLNTSLPRAEAIIYDDVTDSFFAGGDGWIQFSADGINWQLTTLPGSVQGRQITGFARAPGNDGDVPYLYAAFSDVKTIVRSANLATQPLTTQWEDIGNGTTGGTGHAAIASGDGRVFVVSDGGAPEIGWFAQDGTTFTSIGNLAMTVSDLVFGAGRLVAISPSGQIQYADVPDETTIGNWTAPSAALDGAGTRDLAKIEYDGGDATRIGYGFVATLSASGAPGDYVVYTSEDAITWTLRETVSNTQDALGIGVKNPETDLSGTVLVAPAGVVSLSGGNFYRYGFTAPLSRLIVGADGYLKYQNGANAPIIFAPGEWIFPNFAADGTYEARVTNAVFSNGASSFDVSPGPDGSWFTLDFDRAWAVQNGLARFDLEIRKDGGATLAIATYTIGSETSFDPRLETTIPFAPPTP